MDTITLDFETFYSKDYSLSRMTTEEYIRDPRFQVIGVSTKVNDEVPVWFSGTAKETIAHLRSFDWANSMLIAHNAIFDAAILSWRCGIRPKVVADTLSMSRAMFGVDAGHSLKVLASRLGLPAKGDEVTRAIGMRRADFSAKQLHDYGEYCRLDTHLTYEAFREMLARGFPRSEMKLVDLTIKMFTEPMLELDVPHLEGHLIRTQRAKADLIESAGVDRKMLMSNPKFATMLDELGVVPPMKISPTTGKETFAFAKNDEDFQALMEHEDVRVQALVAARVGSKSTLEETRTERLIGIGGRGKFPVPLRYYAAHTGRWGGMDKINMQNLPSRGPNAKQLKKAIRAPEGYMLIDCDSSQIEARVLAWLAGQDDLTAAFARGEDVYKIMASKIYGIRPEDVDKAQRQVGKTTVLGCFASDTEVLTPRGWVPIVSVRDTDMVWDGVEWVNHGGIVDQGVKSVLPHLGVRATSDHEILTERGWVEWSAVCENRHLSQSALRVGCLPYSIGAATGLRAVAPLGGSRGAGARAGGRGSYIERTSSGVGLPDAIPAQRFQQILSGIGSIGMRALTTICGRGSSTDCHLALAGATTQKTLRTGTMAGGESPYARAGGRIEQPSFGMPEHSRGTMTQKTTWIVSTTTRVTSRGIYGLYRAARTCLTAVTSGKCSSASTHSNEKTRTYDLAYAGPRNRYTIRTAGGPMVVHNCGYGVGHHKLQLFLKTQAGVEVDLDEAKRIIDIYRGSNDRISGMWKAAQRTIEYLQRGDAMPFGEPGVIGVDAEDSALILPNGLPIRYDGLYAEPGEKGYEYKYKTRRGDKRIYGGACVENVTQALARIVVGEQMLKIAKRYHVVLTVHDSVVSCVPEADVDEAREYIETCMRWTPDWAAGLPVNCESGVGASYGDCE